MVSISTWHFHKLRGYIGLVLAGGSNRRLPYPKGLLKIPDGRTLIQKNASLLKEFFPEVILSTNTPEVYFSQGLPMIGDIYPERGPLGGIFSAIVALSAEGAFVIACDMPSVRPETIKAILRHAGQAPVVVCRFSGKVHPLLGLYSKEIIPLAEGLLQKGPVRMTEFLKRTRSTIIPENEIKEFDPEGESFRNINTPEDLKKYLR